MTSNNILSRLWSNESLKIIKKLNRIYNQRLQSRLWPIFFSFLLCYLSENRCIQVLLFISVFFFHFQTNIFINGSVDVKYGSVGLEKSCQLTCSPKSACVVSANENDRHSLTTQNDCQSINVFSPALKGPEKHTWESPDDYSDFS